MTSPHMTPPRDDADASSLYERGLAVRRAVLGDTHVDRSLANATSFDADFQRFITQTAWGAVWDRPGLDLRTRSLVTVAILGALRSEELALHVRAARSNGVTDEELSEALLHVAVYGGVPAANTAFKVAKETLGITPATHPVIVASGEPGSTAAGDAQ